MHRVHPPWASEDEPPLRVPLLRPMQQRGIWPLRVHEALLGHQAPSKRRLQIHVGWGAGASNLKPWNCMALASVHEALLGHQATSKRRLHPMG